MGRSKCLANALTIVFLAVPFLALNWLRVVKPPAVKPTPLRNTYWLLRHGRSLANEAGLVVASKEEGIKSDWRLATLGQEQAVAAGQLFKTQLAALPAAPILVITSPFSRTVETATLAAAQVGVTPDQKQSWQVADELVERYFGSAAELKPGDELYEAAWRQDLKSVDARPGGDGESLAMVSARIKSLFQRLESQYQGIHILLVSHGDTLSICQATMIPGGYDLRKHRDFAFSNAQLRRLN